MATYATGITATWNSVSFTEVFALSLTTGAQRQGRDFPWPQGQGGSITVSAFGSANMQTSNIGLRKAVTISGGNVTFNGFGIMDAVTADPELNGVTRFSATITLCD
jgi:hypothetical protein